MAIDTPAGLVVPNIKQVQKKDLRQVNKELKELIVRVKASKQTKEDLENGTFTVSNIGGIGVNAGMPLIFRPQVCIGAIGAPKVIAKFRKEKDGSTIILPSDMLTLCMTMDHRIVDGATGARFSKRVKQLLEEPELMTIYLK